MPKQINQIPKAPPKPSKPIEERMPTLKEASQRIYEDTMKYATPLSERNRKEGYAIDETAK